jgi:hypothetical protein
MVLVRAPGGGRMVFALIFFLATGMMFVGLWTRVSSAVSALTVAGLVYYFGHFRGIEAWTHHHTSLLMMSTVLIALTPCGRSFSVDRYLAVKRAEKHGVAPPEEHGELWGLRLIQVLLFCVYFWASVSKLSPGYLSGERMQHLLMQLYFGSTYPSWPGFALLCLAMAWGALVSEIALAFGLFVPRWLKYLIPLGILLHASFYIVFPVSTFSLNMILLYLAFVPVGWVHEGLDEMMGHPTESP